MAWAAVAGQHAHGNEFAASPAQLVLTLPANAAANNRVAVEANVVGNSVTPSQSVAGLGATWHEDTFTTGANGSFNERNSVFSAVVVTPGTAITISFSGGAASVMGGGANCQEYSGTATAGGAGDVDVASSSTGTSGTPSTTTAVTTAANELVFGGYGDDGSNVSQTGGSGFTVRDNLSPNTVAEALAEDKDSGASGGAQTANLGNTVAQRWFMSCAVYKLAAGGAQDTPELDGKPFGLRGQVQQNQLLAA